MGLFNSIYSNLHNPHMGDDCEFRKDIFELDLDVFNMLRFTEENTENIYKDYPNLLSTNDDKEYPPTGTCIPFEKKMFVTVDGKIMPCERIDHKFYFGYVDKGRIRLDFEQVAQKYNGYLDNLQHDCSACYSKTTCIHCIYQLDDIEKSNTHCPFLMNKAEYQDFCSSCEKYISSHPTDYTLGLERVKVQ